MTRLAVTHLDGDTAVVALDAVLRVSGTTAKGERQEWSAHARGPVKLVREPDGWRVVDLVVDGCSLQMALFTVEGQRASADGIAAEVLGGRVKGERLMLYVELAISTSDPVEVRRAAVGTRGWNGLAWRWHEAELPSGALDPGTTRLPFASGFDAAPREGVRLLLDTDAGFLDVRPGDVRTPRTSIPQTTRLRGYAWLLQLLGIGLAAGVYYDWWVAGLTLFLSGAWVMFLMLLQLRKHPVRRLLPPLAGAAGIAVAGAVLVFASGGVFFLPWSDYQRERDGVRRYVEERFAPQRVVRVSSSPVTDDCDDLVWFVQTNRQSLVVFADPLEGAPLFESASLYNRRIDACNADG